MENQRFDHWAMRLGHALDRRRAAGLLTALGLTALLAPAPEMTARKKRKHKGKNRNKKKPKKPCKNGAVKCGQTCVDLDNNARHCGACNQACQGGLSCQGGQCTPEPSICGSGGNCLVFATSTTYQGNLGGLAGADQKCNDRAQAASRPGAYKAWLSDSTGSPSSRFVHSTGQYVLVTGLKIADDWADLTNDEPNHRLDHEINRDEFGSEITVDNLSRFTWSNTMQDGTLNDADRHCQNWSTNEGTPNFGNAGNVNATDSFWTYATSIFCSNPGLRLYCVQQS